MQIGKTWAAACLALAGMAGAAAADDPSYAKDVKPFLTKYCMDCHSGGKPKAGYSVDSFDGLTKTGRKGPLVVAEKPDRSKLVQVLEGKGGKPMPPRQKPQPTADEISKVRKWIKVGAKDDSAADQE
jgi:hypothetical protein